MQCAVSGAAGLTLIELMIAVAIVGILASIAVPALLGARRHANQAAAAASLRAIADAEHTFASACGRGYFATRLPQLADPPSGGGPAYLSSDLASADVVTKSGYQIRLAGGSDGEPAALDACNGTSAGELASSFVATASPAAPPDGALYYWVGVPGQVYVLPLPITSTAGLGQPAGAQPLGGDAGRSTRSRPAGHAQPPQP